MPQLSKDWQNAIGTTAAESKAQRLLRIEDELLAKRAAGRAETTWYVYKLTLLVLALAGTAAGIAWHFGMFGAPIVERVVVAVPAPQPPQRPAFISVPSGPVTIVEAPAPVVQRVAIVPAPAAAPVLVQPLKPLDPKILERIKHLDAGIDLMEREEKDGDAEAGRMNDLIADAHRRLREIASYCRLHPRRTLDDQRQLDNNSANAYTDIDNANHRLGELAQKRASLEDRVKKADAEAQALDRQMRQ
jgi:hypothetical protein